MIFDFFRRNVPSDAHDGTRNAKPRAVAFVDYEHWYISMDNFYHRKPDLKGWRDELAARFEITEIIFFADFSNPSLRSEISRIREITNVIIETQNSSPRFQKDFTDFIMLDHIYQKAMSSGDIDTFIIFTGDGHFSSVASFLRTRIGKPVVVYAVKDAISSQLRGTASETIELPHAENKPTFETKPVSETKPAHTERPAAKVAPKSAQKLRETKAPESKTAEKQVRKAVKQPTATQPPKQAVKPEPKQPKPQVTAKAAETPVKNYAEIIIRNLKYIEDSNKAKEKPSLPTFWGTVDVVSRLNSASKTRVTEAMRGLIADGYLYQTEQAVGSNPDVKVINVNWDKAKKDGLI